MSALLEKPKKESVLEKAALSCNRILFKICFNEDQIVPKIKGNTVENKEYIENMLSGIRSGKIKNRPAIKALAESWDELPASEKEKFRKIKKT